MATAKPSRTRKHPLAKPLTPAQKQRQRDQIARQQAREDAIQRGIDAGLLAPGPALQPAEWQPKPERPVDTNG